MDIYPTVKEKEDSTLSTGIPYSWQERQWVSVILTHRLRCKPRISAKCSFGKQQKMWRKGESEKAERKRWNVGGVQHWQTQMFFKSRCISDTEVIKHALIKTNNRDELSNTVILKYCYHPSSKEFFFLIH